ncbi:glycoside hydrolase family protein [Pseudoalteromonas luteoviolacea]|uniref:Lysozyme n=3 Tax=Pseudoalteromonas luteoviolacea TaxID=43657 RepID=A0A162B335_9GAMM|nr:glycoside hydrolase family protein [Pseudoalteromonas luteoviolacea]AOT09375.1 glycoside hydrolase [Pseudoalteromonas luteoviolacea]AOT14287.1 glycoside hydrolase [Pseudoalteromonas luteoviolacea]AOT19203.1 glycoside hydrolase [Pseudoalteromonas luteoviolacea]KID58252.1 glycoside hydrolase [Pseudoalteromonas luteoviolacea]KKE83085.1 glycoside hydrolase [Pseudoalteromonas luteoviolacea S4054]
MSIMNTVEQIKKHEGYRRFPYYCTGGKLTIGYGRNLDNKGVDKEEAEYLLAQDIQNALAGVKRRIDISHCNEARVAVLTNMAFNIGLQGLMGFKRMLEHVQQGEFESAAVEMLDSRWANQVPSRAQELAQQMLSGEWQS